MVGPVVPAIHKPPVPVLQGKVAVITGASRGIGQVVSERLAREGARMVLAARSIEQLKQTADNCLELGAESAHVYSVDLRDPELTSEFAKMVLAEHSEVSMLVNNAGILPKKDTVSGGDLKSWQAAMQVNLFAPMVLTNFFSPGMVQAGGGLIINIASIAGVDAFHEHPVYCATKWGLRGFSHSCYEALRNQNVKVVCINPAPVDTDMATGRFLPERLLQPGDIAEAVMLAVNTSQQCIPSDVTLRLALSAKL